MKTLGRMLVLLFLTGLFYLNSIQCIACNGHPRNLTSDGGGRRNFKPTIDLSVNCQIDGGGRIIQAAQFKPEDRKGDGGGTR